MVLWVFLDFVWIGWVDVDFYGAAVFFGRVLGVVFGVPGGLFCAWVVVYFVDVS